MSLPYRYLLLGTCDFKGLVKIPKYVTQTIRPYEALLILVLLKLFLLVNLVGVTNNYVIIICV